MINFNALTLSETTEPLPGGRVSLGTFHTYGAAQHVVDTLADASFEVASTQIIGSDLRMIEQVTGRQTWPSAILAGVARGAWFGLFIGLLLSILDTTSFLGAIIWGVGWGALCWGAFAAFDYGQLRGRHDFTSLSVTVPTTFEVLVTEENAARARSILATAV